MGERSTGERLTLYNAMGIAQDLIITLMTLDDRTLFCDGSEQ